MAIQALVAEAKVVELLDSRHLSYLSEFEMRERRSLSPDRLLGAAVVLAALLCSGVVGCTNKDSRPSSISEPEAEAVLVEVVSVAGTGNFEELCSYPGATKSMCHRHLAFAGTPAPSLPPVIIATRELAADPNPGLVLRLCGERESGARYMTDFVVWRVSGNLVVQDPVYWSGILIQDVVTGETPLAQKQVPSAECD